MKRRKFLWLGLTGITGFAAGGTYIFQGFDDVVRKILITDLKGLQVEMKMINRYIYEAKADHYWGYSRGQMEFIKLNTVFSSLPLPLKYKSKYKQLRSNIVGTFLLSTDFFIYKMDVKRKINYISYYNPYYRPCYNPFSNLFYPLV